MPGGPRSEESISRHGRDGIVVRCWLMEEEGGALGEPSTALSQGASPLWSREEIGDPRSGSTPLPPCPEEPGGASALCAEPPPHPTSRRSRENPAQRFPSPWEEQARAGWCWGHPPRPHKSPPRPWGRSRSPSALLLLLPFPSPSYKTTSPSPLLSPTAPSRAPNLPLYLSPLGVGREGLGFYPRDELLHPVLGAPRHSPAPREMTAGFDIPRLISCSFRHPRRKPFSKSTARHRSLAILLLLAPFFIQKSVCHLGINIY